MVENYLDIKEIGEFHAGHRDRNEASKHSSVALHTRREGIRAECLVGIECSSSVSILTMLDIVPTVNFTVLLERG